MGKGLLLPDASGGFRGGVVGLDARDDVVVLPIDLWAGEISSLKVVDLISDLL